MGVSLGALAGPADGIPQAYRTANMTTWTALLHTKQNPFEYLTPSHKIYSGHVLRLVVSIIRYYPTSTREGFLLLYKKKQAEKLRGPCHIIQPLSFRRAKASRFPLWNTKMYNLINLQIQILKVQMMRTYEQQDHPQYLKVYHNRHQILFLYRDYRIHTKVFYDLF